MTPDPCDVRAVNGSDLKDEQIAPFIQAAGCILDSVAGCTSAKNITDQCLHTAQTWLAAHLLAMTSLGQSTNPAVKERFENYNVERLVGSFDGGGVMATSYGQTANTLLQGCLAEVDKSPALVAFFG